MQDHRELAVPYHLTPVLTFFGHKLLLLTDNNRTLHLWSMCDTYVCVCMYVWVCVCINDADTNASLAWSRPQTLHMRYTCGTHTVHILTSVVHLTLDGVNGKWRWRRISCQIDGESSRLRRQLSEFSDGNAVIYNRYLRCHFWKTPYVHNTDLDTCGTHTVQIFTHAVHIRSISLHIRSISWHMRYTYGTYLDTCGTPLYTHGTWHKCLILSLGTRAKSGETNTHSGAEINIWRNNKHTVVQI